MEDYEIRLRNRQSKKASAFRISQASDLAAICRAHAVASTDDSIEVWKGMTCIYADGKKIAFPAMAPAPRILAGQGAA